MTIDVSGPVLLYCAVCRVGCEGTVYHLMEVFADWRWKPGRDSGVGTAS